MTYISEHLAFQDHRRVKLAGIRVDAVDARGADILRPLLERPGCDHVITVNANYLRLAASDSRLKDVINSATVVVPDGMPVVWAMKRTGAQVQGRTTGHDLAEALIELSVAEGISLYFLGAGPGIADGAARNVKARYPGVRIAGTYSPPPSAYPFPDDENERMITAINASDADAVLVALGCPKQDLWLADHRRSLNASVAVGVGCVLDVLAGSVKRAPAWVQSSGLEWFYRMYQEPRRLTTRYLQDAMFLSDLLVRGRTEGPRATS